MHKIRKYSKLTETQRASLNAMHVAKEFYRQGKEAESWISLFHAICLTTGE